LALSEKDNGNTKNYYQALEEADRQADSTPFIRFMLSVIAEALVQSRPQNAPANAPVKRVPDVSGLKTPEAIVALLAAKSELTRQQLGDTMGKDIRTIGRALAKLQQAGKIKRVGSDKTGHWEVQP
jgi:predicted HTH transcriptional regulator